MFQRDGVHVLATQRALASRPFTEYDVFIRVELRNCSGAVLEGYKIN